MYGKVKVRSACPAPPSQPSPTTEARYPFCRPHEVMPCRADMSPSAAGGDGSVCAGRVPCTVHDAGRGYRERRGRHHGVYAPQQVIMRARARSRRRRRGMRVPAVRAAVVVAARRHPRGRYGVRGVEQQRTSECVVFRAVANRRAAYAFSRVRGAYRQAARSMLQAAAVRAGRKTQPKGGAQRLPGECMLRRQRGAAVAGGAGGGGSQRRRGERLPL